MELPKDSSLSLFQLDEPLPQICLAELILWMSFHVNEDIQPSLELCPFRMRLKLRPPPKPAPCSFTYGPTPWLEEGLRVHSITQKLLPYLDFSFRLCTQPLTEDRGPELPRICAQFLLWMQMDEQTQINPKSASHYLRGWNQLTRTSGQK